MAGFPRHSPPKDCSRQLTIEWYRRKAQSNSYGHCSLSIGTLQFTRTVFSRAVQAAEHLYNRRPHSSLQDRITPYEALFTKVPNLHYLRTFGCVAYRLLQTNERQKIQPRAQKLIHIGYAHNQKAYLLYDPISRKQYASRDVEFDEECFDFGFERNRSVMIDYSNPLILGHSESPHRETATLDPDSSSDDIHHCLDPDHDSALLTYLIIALQNTMIILTTTTQVTAISSRRATFQTRKSIFVAVEEFPGPLASGGKHSMPIPLNRWVRTPAICHGRTSPPSKCLRLSHHKQSHKLSAALKRATGMMQCKPSTSKCSTSTRGLCKNFPAIVKPSHVNGCSMSNQAWLAMVVSGNLKLVW